MISAPPRNITSDSWLASLDLRLERKGAKTVVSESRQQGPLTIQTPFYPEDDTCHIYLLHPPAGIVGGDSLHLGVEVAKGGHGLITTPGATKFYKTNGRFAHQNQQFTIGEGSIFEWLPQETIYFPDAHAKLSTRVDLDGDAIFLGWEIHCLGLPVNGKDLAEGKANISFSLYRDGLPLLIESLAINSGKKNHPAHLNGQQVMANFVATGTDADLCEKVRELTATKGLFSTTLIDDILIIRYLGSSTNEARTLFTKAWQMIRPQIIKKTTCSPRIWAT